MFTWVDVSTYLRGLSPKEAPKEVVRCTKPLRINTRGPNILEILLSSAINESRIATSVQSIGKDREALVEYFKGFSGVGV